MHQSPVHPQPVAGLLRLLFKSKLYLISVCVFTCGIANSSMHGGCIKVFLIADMLSVPMRLH